MKNKIILITLWLTISMMLVACGSEDNNIDISGTNQQQEEKFDLYEYPESNLTQDIIDSLAYMGNEERLAYDIYTELYKYHLAQGTQINQLANIPKSERVHVEIVQEIIQRYNIDTGNLTDVIAPVAGKDVAFEDMPTGKYDIPVIQDLYDTLHAKGINSKQEALEVGCIVEVVDIEDLDKFIIQAQYSNASDIVAAFNVLRDGSYSHYWAFNDGLKAMGVENGCGVLGEEWQKTPEEYPKKSAGRGNKQH